MNEKEALRRRNKKNKKKETTVSPPKNTKVTLAVSALGRKPLLIQLDCRPSRRIVLMIVIAFFLSSRTDPDDDVVDVTSLSALDVVEIEIIKVIAFFLGPT